MATDFVIAVDFDGTLERGGDYPVPGTPNYELIGSYYEQAKNNLVAAEQEYNEHGADTSVKLCCPICGKKLEGTSCPDCGVDL